jgi:N-methylhydantoinase B
MRALDETTDSSFDLISLEILWSALVTVVNEQAAALVRTSFTPIVRDSGDLSAAFFDARGRMLAQADTGTPGHINSLATAMKHFLGVYPPDGLQPGDVLITNDPWKTSGQLNDLSIVTPAFYESRLAGYFGSTCHAIDIGGRGLSADASEVFEEGLFIPISKLHDAGKVNQTLMDLIAANVRAPAEVLGDIEAQIAGNAVGCENLAHYLREFELKDVEKLGTQIIRRSEAVMRSAIAALPDGRYAHKIHTDGLDERLTIACTVTVDGDEVTGDYTGSSPQTKRGMNVVLNYTTAYTVYGLKCALAPEVPNNEGSFLPLHVTAPEGTILNPRFPAAVAARHIVGHFLPHVVFGALVPVIPERVIAEGSGNIWLTTVRGIGEHRFVSAFFAAGGMGAGPRQDGLSATSFPSGIATTPVEVLETISPLVIRSKELRPDSGGAGKYRGGLGQTIQVEVRTGEPYVVSVLCDRVEVAAEGYLGGQPGARGDVRTSERARALKLSQVMPRGASFTLELPGGGGFQHPSERDPEAVARDVMDGLVSEDAAVEIYGRANQP